MRCVMSAHLRRADFSDLCTSLGAWERTLEIGSDAAGVSGNKLHAGQ